MKVLTVLHTLGYGGIEVTLLRSVPYFSRHGIRIGVAYTGPKGPLEEEFRAQGVVVHKVSVPAPRLTSFAPIASIATKYEYDLIHSRFGYNAGGHVLGASLARRPCVVSFHNARPSREVLGWRPYGFRALALKPWLSLNSLAISTMARKVIGHSKANLDAFVPDWRARPEKFAVVLNGIDLPSLGLDKVSARKMLGLSEDRPIVLHVGSFKPEKNHEELLKMFRHFLRSHPGSMLVLVGDGALRPRIEAEIKRLGLGECTVLAGHQRRPEHYFAAADLLVFPSRSEGYGNVLVEAQAMGLPIVASDIPAHREAVAEPQRKFLFPLGDVDRAVALAREQFACAAKGANPWVEESKEIVWRRNSIEAMVDGLVEIYREVLNGK